MLHIDPRTHHVEEGDAHRGDESREERLQLPQSRTLQEQERERVDDRDQSPGPDGDAVHRGIELQCSSSAYF